MVVQVGKSRVRPRARSHRNMRHRVRVRLTPGSQSPQGTDPITTTNARQSPAPSESQLMLIKGTRRRTGTCTASALGCCGTRLSSLRPRSGISGAACIAVCLLGTLACGGGSHTAPEADPGDIGDSAAATATFTEVY